MASRAGLVCSIADCGRQVNARGWCGRHYWRWRKHGDPLGSKKWPDIFDLIMAKVEKRASGCWVYTGSLVKGYGQVHSVQLGGTKLVHVVVYERLVGPIPKGLELDHRCRVTACCNPADLEPVTHAENLRRGVGLPRLIASRQGWTHCSEGHEFTPENTYVNPGTGGRRCRTCHKIWAQKYYLQRKAMAA